MSRWTSEICNYLLACVGVLHTPDSGTTTILNTKRKNEVGVGFKRAPDLRVAFVAAPDDPDMAISCHELYTLCIRDSLKIRFRAYHTMGDNHLSVGVNVLDCPLQVRVMVNTNNNRVDEG